MVQVLERPMSQRERFLQSFQQSAPQFGQAFSNAMLPHRQKKENIALEKLTGQDFTDVSDDLKKEFIRAHVTGKAQKQLEKENALSLGLGTIQKMRELLPSAGPLKSFQGLLGGETTRNRAELAQLGTSLIPLVAAGVPIRNQKEFEQYKKIITNPNTRQAELEGALNGLEDLFQRSIGAEEFRDEEAPSTSKRMKQKFSPEHPEHRKKAEQLYKTYKDKQKVREILEREFEF